MTFIKGYRQGLVLTAGEIDALPDMMRLYRTWSLIHREGIIAKVWRTK
jgi:Ser/Thr protein kinase RdoA (MazF antagonist)